MLKSPLAALIACIVLCPLGAQAADVPFEGTWASDAAQCPNDQSSQDAPLVLTATTYDQHEAHCKLSSVTQDQGTWSAKAKCSVEGDEQEGTFAFIVDGDKLTIRDDNGERNLSRCP